MHVTALGWLVAFRPECLGDYVVGALCPCPRCIVLQPVCHSFYYCTMCARLVMGNCVDRAHSVSCKGNAPVKLLIKMHGKYPEATLQGVTSGLPCLRDQSGLRA